MYRPLDTCCLELPGFEFSAPAHFLLWHASFMQHDVLGLPMLMLAVVVHSFSLCGPFSCTSLPPAPNLLGHSPVGGH